MGLLPQVILHVSTGKVWINLLCTVTRDVCSAQTCPLLPSADETKLDASPREGTKLAAGERPALSTLLGGSPLISCEGWVERQYSLPEALVAGEITGVSVAVVSPATTDSSHEGSVAAASATIAKPWAAFGGLELMAE